MDIRGENYHISYAPSTATVALQGILRLYGAAGYFSIDSFNTNRDNNSSGQSPASLEDCASLMELFEYIINQQPPVITVDLQKLELLNSAGINTLSKFVIKIRNQNESQIIIKGTEHFFWQSKILGNLKKLMPSLSIEFE